MYQFKIVVWMIFFGFVSLSANITAYQTLYSEENQAFTKKIAGEIKKALLNETKEIQEIYRQIAYRAVWIDSSHLTHNAEVLLLEIKIDKGLGLHSNIYEAYEALLKEQKSVFQTDVPFQKKVALELHFMQLYLKYINSMLEGKNREHTATELLLHGLDKGSLVHAFNTISKERIAIRTESIMLPIPKEAWLVTELNTTLQSAKYKAVKKVYKRLSYQPVWVEKGGLSKLSKALFAEMGKDVTLDENGTLFGRYQTLSKATLPQNKKDAVVLELKIETLYTAYAKHLLYGDIDWKAFQKMLKEKHKHGAWIVHDVLTSVDMLLLKAVKSQSLSDVFKKAQPQYPWYGTLLKALKKYKKIAKKGGWDKLPAFEAITPESNSSILPLVRERLRAEGDYVTCSETLEKDLYDPCLLDAVKHFQKRHGLTAEGYIGKLTQKALNQSVENKIAQIKLNIDRMKWLKRDNEKYRILVNIPDFRMYMFEDFNVIQTMRVITGKKGHETPIFYNRVRSIVLNPYWRIPASIIRHEMLPKLKRDPHYTLKHQIEIHTGYSEHSPKVNPLGVNWHKYGKHLPPYRFMQSPGVKNSLGKMKYLFPNQFSVYMHDTDVKSLFSKEVRAFSHGCVRLHKPRELLQTFSTIESTVNFEKAKKILEHNTKTPIHLNKSIPIDMVYITTWVDQDGSIQFRDDIYGYDKLHFTTLKHK